MKKFKIGKDPDRTLGLIRLLFPKTNAFLFHLIRQERFNEQVRIISLIESRLSPITYEKHECVAVEDIIALIKGENK